MRLILVSHGETEENVKGILQGHTPGKTTTRGMRTVRELALSLKAEKIDAIFSSDLKRAEYTAREIARFHDIPIHFNKELREINVGVFQRRSKEVFHVKQQESGVSLARFKPKGGESMEDARKRAIRFANKIYGKYENKTILFSTHRGFIGCLLSSYLHISLAEARKIKLKNAAMIILDIKGFRVKMVKNTMSK
ncbi:histidine phosphatase family protein [Candidatus Marsarchaeota archaeon]|jgi:broad specificity phosphatase PhoE|nr:histidine phosphatase family protein [Candidatus Marsarchaeota archaeon]